jgi:hypothetical protein
MRGAVGRKPSGGAGEKDRVAVEEGGECMRPGPEDCRVSKLVKARKLLVEDEEVIVVQAQRRGSVHGAGTALL